MNTRAGTAMLNKVPMVPLAFWIIKILVTYLTVSKIDTIAAEDK